MSDKIKVKLLAAFLMAMNHYDADEALLKAEQLLIDADEGYERLLDGKKEALKKKEYNSKFDEAMKDLRRHESVRELYFAYDKLLVKERMLDVTNGVG